MYCKNIPNLLHLNFWWLAVDCESVCDDVQCDDTWMITDGTSSIVSIIVYIWYD